MDYPSNGLAPYERTFNVRLDSLIGCDPLALDRLHRLATFSDFHFRCDLLADTG